MAIEKTLKEIQEFTKSKGHPKCACLLPDYALNTRAIATDYSVWLKNKYSHNETIAIEDFIWAIIRVSPPMGITELTLPRYEAFIRRQVNYLLKKDFGEYIFFFNMEAEIDLRLALILGMLRNNYDGFTMTSIIHKFLTMIMGAHSLKFMNTGNLLSKAYDFRNGMIENEKKIFNNDLSHSYWTKFNLPDNSQIEDLNNINYSAIINFQSKLNLLPLMTRIHLFDLIGLRKNPNKLSLSSINPFKVYHQVKYWGINLTESTSKLIDSGLINKSNESFSLSSNHIEEFVEVAIVYKKILPFFLLWSAFGFDFHRMEVS
ncbi:MAG: hypothetical protein PHP42_09530 [Bacteroidota bacterium]|nr:hypothetical protein [Bacteroidota bacterium]